MAGTSRIGLALVGTVVSGGVVVAGLLGAVSAGAIGARASSPPPLRESTWCAQAAPSIAATPVDAGPNQQVLTVTVPATALVKYDERGRVVAALTNTGCAPRPTDDIYTVHADGTVDPQPTHLVPAVRWTGDFTSPGVYVVQRAVGRAQPSPVATVSGG